MGEFRILLTTQARPTPGHVIFKLSKAMTKIILKIARSKSSFNSDPQ